MKFDVSEWQKLAQTDPEEFERRRVAHIEELIASTPPDIQRRLRGTQFKVDLARGRASNPLSATVRISRLMWESFSQLRERLNQLASQDLDPPPASELPAAQIIPLTSARRTPPNPY